MEEFYEEILFGAIKLINSPENHIFPFQSICGYKSQMRMFPSKIQYLSTPINQKICASLLSESLRNSN